MAASTTYAEKLDAAKDALDRLIAGAKFVTVNGQQFHFSSQDELCRLIDWLETKVAEEAGTDGRGSWEVAFAE